MELKRITGEIIGTGETLREIVEKNFTDLRGANLRGANLRAADLHGATLRDADLRGANLRDADLRGANLRDADLRGANLRDANLHGADMRDADLRGANLRGANLRDADLQDADLHSANLHGANLHGADMRAANLCGADLCGANLHGVAQQLGLQLDASLPARILSQIEGHPDTWDQSVWHNECGTAHCIAGWAIVLSGPLGAFLESNWSTATAAALLLWREGYTLPSFAGDANKAECLARLRYMAAAAAQEQNAQSTAL